ncbi:acyl-[acyl-carrier-protein] thioesterase [Terrisporobacter vanillatitrophus]|uniref:acyl-[acyl-carrier-protein] thioesterase n=1 Tax=Terrisporobacter vanillatitrophus TaxID=3058402 RepID=UPI0033679A3E
MIYSSNYRIGMEEIGVNNEATNKAILAIMEDVSGLHSNYVGYGLFQVETKRVGWMILDWKLKIIKRPKYNDKVIAETWSRGVKRIYAYRDFQIKDEEGNVIAVATSRWILVDIDRRRPLRITEDIANLYETEADKKVFEEEMEDVKYEDYIFKKDYYIQRRDIDINEHMHNLSYLDMAYEILPDEVYKNKVFHNVRIVYKKEIVYGEKVECYYLEQDNKYVVTAKSNDNINAIIELS